MAKERERERERKLLSPHERSSIGQEGFHKRERGGKKRRLKRKRKRKRKMIEEKIRERDGEKEQRNNAPSTGENFFRQCMHQRVGFSCSGVGIDFL